MGEELPKVALRLLLERGLLSFLEIMDNEAPEPQRGPTTISHTLRVEKAAMISRMGLGALEIFLPDSYYMLRPVVHSYRTTNPYVTDLTSRL